jgi:sec-independent protein translocase protein TatC
LIRDREMSLLEHLQELRSRLLIAAIGVLVTTAVSFLFAEQVIRWLMAPGDVDQLTILNPTETFTTYMRVSLFTGIGLAMPVILYQVFRYVDPALHPGERRFLLRMGLPIIALFVLGVAFCYYLLLPSALGFLKNFGAGVFETEWRASEYISFVTTFLLAMGLVFEMPALLFALVKVRVLERRWLARQRRFVFLASFLVAALITPTPDPFNQTLVGLPLYFLFELGLFLARFAEPQRRAGEVLRPAP